MNLNQITLEVGDLEVSAEFYERLGLRRIVWSPPRYARYECPTGASTLSLHASNAPIVAGTALYFEVDDVGAVVEALTDKGVSFASSIDQRWLWREAWGADPDGRRICIYHAGQNRRFPPWRVDAEGPGA